MHTWPWYIVFAFIGSVNIPEELNTPRCKLTFAVQVSSVAVCTTVIGGITMVNTSDTSRPLGGAITHQRRRALAQLLVLLHRAEPAGW